MQRPVCTLALVLCLQYGCGTGSWLPAVDVGLEALSRRNRRASTTSTRESRSWHTIIRVRVRWAAEGDGRFVGSHIPEAPSECAPDHPCTWEALERALALGTSTSSGRAGDAPPGGDQ